MKLKKSEKFLSMLLATALVFSMVPSWAMAASLDVDTKFDKNTTYDISTEEDLINLSNLVNKGQDGKNSTFKLTNDIVLTKDFTPIGKNNDSFSGIFDGNGFVISASSGVSIGNSNQNSQGLFGETSSTAVIKNLGVNASVVGKDDIGVIAGKNLGTIENCYSQGSAQAQDGDVGGIAGFNKGTIKNCYSASTLPKGNAGSIVGKNQGTVNNCYFDSDKVNEGIGTGNGNTTGLTTTQMTGNNAILNMASFDFLNDWKVNKDGLPSLSKGESFSVNNEFDLTTLATLVNSGNDLQGKTIELNSDIELTQNFMPIGSDSNKFSGTFNGNNHVISTGSGVVIGNASEVSQGLFGVVSSTGTIHNLGVKAEVIGLDDVGGIVGKNLGNIYECYFMGTATGADDVGGIAGYNGANGKIENCFNTGDIASTLSGSTGNENDVGGIVGDNKNGKVISCYSIGNVQGTDNVGAVVGNNDGGTVQMSYFDKNTVTITVDGVSQTEKNAIGISKGSTNTLHVNGMTTQEMTGVGVGRAEQTLGFIKNPWVFTADTEDFKKYYPVFSGVSKTDMPYFDAGVTVEFDSTGETTIDDILIEMGTKVTKPTDPEKTGYTFDTWYNGEEEFSFDTAINVDTTLTATWTLNDPTVTLTSVDETYSGEAYEIEATASHDVEDAVITYKWFKEIEGVYTEIKDETSKTLEVTYVADSGKYKVEVTATVGNESTTETAECEVKIAKKEVSVVIEDTETYIGMTVPTFTSTVTGDLTDEKVEIEYTEAKTETVGEYTITMTNTADYPNYDITVTDGKFTVKEKETYTGDSVEIVYGENGEVEFTIDVDHSKFLNLTFCGYEVEKTAYTVQEGSTVITLNEDYVNTFIPGKHEIIANFTDGSATLTLTVKEAVKPSETPSPTPTPSGTPSVTPTVSPTPSEEPQTDTPDTGDNGVMPIVISMVFAIVGIFVILRKKSVK